MNIWVYVDLDPSSFPLVSDVHHLLSESQRDKVGQAGDVAWADVPGLPDGY